MSSLEECMATVPQDAFLRGAMRTLGMTRKSFAERFGVAEKTLDNWMLSPGGSGHRRMPLIAWKYIHEVLQDRPV